MGNYEDIIDRKWTGSPKRRRMDLVNRAKIFLPFAALRGFEEAIEAKNRILVKKEKLSEYKEEQLNNNFYTILYEVKNKRHPEVKLVYCFEDLKKDEIQYIQVDGLVVRIDLDARYIQVVNEKIAIDSIVSIDILD